MRVIALLLVLASPVQAAEQSTKQRLINFFQRNNTKNAAALATIIADNPAPLHKKKIIAAIIVPESRGDSTKVSKKGAQGVCQLMPFWKRALNITGSLKDPKINIDAAFLVYDQHLKRAKGDVHQALEDYSGGSEWYPDHVLQLAKEI